MYIKETQRGNNLRRLDGQQNSHQIFLNILCINCSSKQFRNGKKINVV